MRRYSKVTLKRYRCLLSGTSGLLEALGWSSTLQNFDERPLELQVRGKSLDSSGKIMLNDQPVARFEGGILAPIAGRPDKLETVSKLTVASLGMSTPSMRSSIIPDLRHAINRCRHGCDRLRVLVRYF